MVEANLTAHEVEACLYLVERIKEMRKQYDPEWLPSDEEVHNELVTATTPNPQLIKVAQNMVTWIRIGRREKCYSDSWLPGYADILKSSLFSRIRAGKKVLAYPPPTAYSYPWYELIDNPQRAYWAHECHAQQGEENAYIAQCQYKVETWTDEEKRIPFSVSFGSYLFRVLQGPLECPSVRNNGVETIQGWWIKYVPNPLVPGAFDLEQDDLPWRLNQKDA